MAVGWVGAVEFEFTGLTLPKLLPRFTPFLPTSASSFRPEGVGAGVAARPNRVGGAFCATMAHPARNPAFGIEKADQ